MLRRKNNNSIDGDSSSSSSGGNGYSSKPRVSFLSFIGYFGCIYKAKANALRYSYMYEKFLASVFIECVFAKCKYIIWLCKDSCVFFFLSIHLKAQKRIAHNFQLKWALESRAMDFFFQFPSSGKLQI